MINGLIPVLLTPFNNDLTVDLTAQINLVEKFENLQKIEKYWLFGTGGEDWSVDREERLKVVDILNTRFDLKKFIIGTNLGNLQRSKEFALELSKRYGAGLIIHYMNPYPKYDQKAIIETYRIFMQDNPLKNFAYFSDNFTSECVPETLIELSKISNLCGVKYSTSSGTKMADAKIHDNENFSVIPAVIKTLFSNLSSGFSCSTTVEANLFAPQIIKVFDDFLIDTDKARSRQQKLAETIVEFKTPISKSNYVSMPEMKYVLSKLGVCAATHSMDLRPLTTKDKQYLEEIVLKNSHELGWLV